MPSDARQFGTQGSDLSWSSHSGISFKFVGNKKQSSFRGVPTGPRKARPDDRLGTNYGAQLRA